MKKITARAATAADAEQFAEWVMDSRTVNMVDPDAITYPTSMVIATETDEEQITYVPVQFVLMAEALATHPKASKLQIALALRKTDEGLEQLARNIQVRELYFLSKSPAMIKLAQANGYEKLDFSILRRKI